MKPQIVALLLAGAMPIAWAQAADPELPPPPPKEEQKEKVEKGDKGKPEKPEKPEVAEQKAGGRDTVQEIKSDFRSKADEYVRRQKQLLDDLKNAKGEDKKKIREQLNDLKDQWKSDQLAAAREILADHKDKIDREKGKGGAGGRPRD